MVVEERNIDWIERETGNRNCSKKCEAVLGLSKMEIVKSFWDGGSKKD